MTAGLRQESGAAKSHRTFARIVAGWPRAFAARRARALGFAAEVDLDEVVRVYVEDELGP